MAIKFPFLKLDVALGNCMPTLQASTPTQLWVVLIHRLKRGTWEASVIFGGSGVALRENPKPGGLGALLQDPTFTK